MIMNKIKVCNVLAYVILFLLILSVSPFILPKVFGYEPYGILSNSMEPELRVGSVVYIKACEPSEVVKGDIITFRTSVQNDTVATHRVMINDAHASEFITKGDHNDEVDATPVAYERLLGKVACSIPLLGTFYLWLVSAMGMALCTFSLMMVILLWYFVGKWKKEMRQK